MKQTNKTTCIQKETDEKEIKNDRQQNTHPHIFSMPKGIYLVDMDGVLFNYTKKLEEIWNELYPHLSFDHREQTTFYTEDYLPLKYGRDAENYKSQIEHIADTYNDFFENLEPMEGALEGIVKLAENNPVYICTAPNIRNDYCAMGKIKSIRKHLGEDWVRRTIITKDKTLVQADYLIDDKPEITDAFKKPWTQILYDQPYNRNIETNYRFTWNNGLISQSPEPKN